MKVVLLSGSKKDLTPKKVCDYINNNIKDIVVSFIATDFAEYNSNDKYVNKLVNSFSKNNVNFKSFNIIDNRLNKSSMLNLITKSNLIFLLGGDTLKQIDTINKLKLRTAIDNIKNNGIIMGMSAGAINLANKVILARDIEDNIPKLSIYEGLGFTNLNIEPHCDFKNEEHLKDLKEASKIGSIIVMHDNAYIIIDDEKTEFYGDYFILYFENIYTKNTLSNFLKEINYD